MVWVYDVWGCEASEQPGLVGRIGGHRTLLHTIEPPERVLTHPERVRRSGAANKLRLRSQVTSVRCPATGASACSGLSLFFQLSVLTHPQ